jgi:hypothetical protein
MRLNLFLFHPFRTARVLAVPGFFLSFVVSCSSGRVGVPPEEYALSLAARPWADSLDLQEGERLFRAKCAACHGLPDPADHPASAWPGLVRKMAPRSSLDTAQSRRLLDWILLGGLAQAFVPSSSPTENTP